MTEHSDTPNADEFLDTLFNAPEPKPIVPARRNAVEWIGYAVGGVIFTCFCACVAAAALFSAYWFLSFLWRLV